MNNTSIWILITSLALVTFLLRSSFIVFGSEREIPESIRRYLRYVSVAVLPGMVAGLIAFPASMDGRTNIAWLGASLAAVLVGLKWKKPLVIMIAGAITFIALEFLT